MLVPENLEVLSLRHWVEYESNARYNSIENDYGTIWEGYLYQHLYVQVACTLEMSWRSV